MNKFLTCCLVIAILAAPSIGSARAQKNAAGSIAIPMQMVSGWVPGIFISIGNGPRAVAAIDTSLPFLIAAKSIVGPNIEMTGEQVSVTLSQLSGASSNSVTANANVAIGVVQLGNNPALRTTGKVPILVVPDSDMSANNPVLLGMGMNGQTGILPFLPRPYNQMVTLNLSQQKILFGTLPAKQMAKFNFISLGASECQNIPVKAKLATPCWNINVPVKYTIQSGAQKLSQMLETDFTTLGYATHLWLNALPSWIKVQDGVVTSQVSMTANVSTSKGSQDLPLATPYKMQAGDPSAFIGRQLYMQQAVIFDSQKGRIGIGPTNFAGP